MLFRSIGTLAKGGRDKLTFVADPEIATLGAWLEQLIAESTGKHGVGIVPVDLEPLGSPDRYGDDRVFVRLALRGSSGPAATDEVGDADELLAELATLGHPVIRIALTDPMDLGGEFVRWEVATAIAGAVLGIDPFDQPNVEEAKQLTRAVLAAKEAGVAPAPAVPLIRGEGLALFPVAALRGAEGTVSLVGALAAHLARRGPKSYLALQAFIAPSPAVDAAALRIRRLLRDATGRATTFGYGPRFLHSTGQLHKGGAPIGWFLQLTADHPVDRPIPDAPFTFGELVDAQAAGDFAAIEGHDLPIVRIHLGADPATGMAALERALAAALGTTQARG